MLLEHEQKYGLGMNALVTICSWNTNGTMVWAWMLWSRYAPWNTNGIMIWAWKLWSPYALGTRTELWFGHECSGHCMLLEHERNYGLGMDALVTVCSRNTNGIMIWAWKLWSPYALGTRAEIWFGHGCSGHRMLLERERKYCLGMGALVTVGSRITNSSMLFVWTRPRSYARHYGLNIPQSYKYTCPASVHWHPKWLPGTLHK